MLDKITPQNVANIKVGRKCKAYNTSGLHFNGERVKMKKMNFPFLNSFI